MSSLNMMLSGPNNSWLFIADEARDDLYQPRFNYNYQLRGKEAAGQPNNWNILWPMATMMCGDPSTGDVMLGQDACNGAIFEYPSTISRGIYRPNFFRGVCRDTNGTPLGGATVACYLTAGDLWVSVGSCDDDGQYEVMTPYPGQAHYLVARYASGNLAGATVNTLIPV